MSKLYVIKRDQCLQWLSEDGGFSALKKNRMKMTSRAAASLVGQLIASPQTIAWGIEEIENEESTEDLDARLTEVESALVNLAGSVQALQGLRTRVAALEQKQGHAKKRGDSHASLLVQMSRKIVKVEQRVADLVCPSMDTQAVRDEINRIICEEISREVKRMTLTLVQHRGE